MPSNINFFYLPYHNVGGHFLLWTVYFLSDQKIHWAQNQSYPVTQIKDFQIKRNFHDHQPVTMLFGAENLKKFMESIDNIDARCFPVNVYLANELLSVTVQKKFAIDISHASLEQINECIELQKQQMRSILISLQKKGYPVIFVDCYQQDHLVSFYNDRYVLDWNRQHLPDKKIFLENYIDTFFHKIDNFHSKDIWDQRELLALNIGPIIGKQDYLSCIDLTQPNLVYNTDDLWNFFDECLDQLFRYLDLDIKESKRSDWNKVYQQWRKVHQPSFARDLNNIIEKIVSGQFMDLSRYQMTFFHEVLIQHFLIHEKKLTLKNWNLIRFPSNTVDLHRLLEPNFHALI